MIKCVSVLVAVLASAAAFANMLTDPGFESVREGAFTQWQIPGSWQGELRAASGEGAARSGRYAAELAVTEARGRWMGRMFSARPVRVRPSVRYRFSVWAKGSGDLVVGCLEYGERDGRRIFNYTGSDQTAALTPEWQKVDFFYVQEEPTAYRIVPYFEIRGEGGRALLDDGEFVEEPAPGYALAVRAGHTMAPQGGSVDFRISAEAPAGQPQVAVRVHLPEAEPADSAVEWADGAGRFALQLPADGPAGLCQLDFFLEEGGVAVREWVDVVSPEAYEEFAAAARAVELPLPFHFVFVGDSLTAQQRGYNYVDKVRGWLRWRFGDAAKVTNAGVGGDFLRRVRARLEEDVLAIEPTRVFIFLGHNDSKLSSTSDYERPVTAFDQVAPLFAEIIGRIRDEAGASSTVMAASSSVYEATSARAAQRAEAGRAHNLFGKPEALEEFNAGALQAAQETGSDYMDIYAATKDHPDKPSLFSADGVHLSAEGNRFIALQVLKDLGKQ